MSRQPHAAFDLSGFLPYQLDAVASMVSEALFDLYGERHDLRVPDWRVLVWLHHAPELAAKDIALRARMDKATVSRALARLESLDLVARAVAEGDQRSQALELTRRGRTLLARLLPEVQRWEASLLEPFSASERRQLRDLLGRLEERLRECSAKPGTPPKRATAAERATKEKAPKVAKTKPAKGGRAQGTGAQRVTREVDAAKPQRPKATAATDKAAKKAKAATGKAAKKAKAATRAGKAAKKAKAATGAGKAGKKVKASR